MSHGGAVSRANSVSPQPSGTRLGAPNRREGTIDARRRFVARGAEELPVAAAARTLVDVLGESVRRFGERTAVDTDDAVLKPSGRPSWSLPPSTRSDWRLGCW
jgi:hypothetical protein